MQAMPGSLESLLAVALDNIEDLKREVQRNRETIHTLRSTVSALDHLPTLVRELQAAMPRLARQSARQAVDEAHRRRHANVAANLRTYAAVLSAGAALGGMIVTLILRG